MRRQLWGRAFATARQQVPQAELLIVGDGELRASLVAQARELARQRHEADHELIASVEVPLPVVAQKEPVVLEPPCLGRLSRRLPQQDGWCHVSHITLSGRCETWWGSQLTADASSTISSRSSKRVMANTR